jgi:hypothetical protein
MNTLLSPFALFFQFFARAARAVVGDISWRPPGWIRDMGRHPFRAIIFFAVLIGLIVGGIKTWRCRDRTMTSTRRT